MDEILLQELVRSAVENTNPPPLHLEIDEDSYAYHGARINDAEENASFFTHPRWKELSIQVVSLKADRETMRCLRRQAGLRTRGDIERYIARSIAIWMIADERYWRLGETA